MAQFSKIIGTILCDVIQAQHEANLYAGRLCEEYRKGGKAAGLHLPHATIGDIELTLKYGIENGESKREQFETDYRGLYVFLKSFSSQMAKSLISTLINSVKAVDVVGKSEAQHVWSLLSDESKEYRKLLTYLSRRIYCDLASATELFVNEHGSVLTEPLVNTLCETARKDLLFLPDIDVLFSEKKGQKLRTKIDNTMADTLTPFVNQLVSGISFSNKRVVSATDVIVDASKLEKIPVECIHSIRLKLSLPDSLQNVEPNKKE